MKITWKLFIIFLRIGAFTFGGGYAMIPLIEREVVDKHHWLTTEEFMDVLAVCQSTPGAIAVNQAVFIGYKINRYAGAAAATLGVVLPSFFVMLVIAASFATIQSQTLAQSIFKGVRPAVVALIASAGIRLTRFTKTGFDLVVIVSSFLAITWAGVNPVFVVVIAAILGVVRYRYAQKGVGR